MAWAEWPFSRFLTGLKLVGDRLIAFVHDHYGKAAIRMQVSGGKQITVIGTGCNPYCTGSYKTGKMPQVVIGRGQQQGV